MEHSIHKKISLYEEILKESVKKDKSKFFALYYEFKKMVMRKEITNNELEYILDRAHRA